MKSHLENSLAKDARTTKYLQGAKVKTMQVPRREICWGLITRHITQGAGNPLVGEY